MAYSVFPAGGTRFKARPDTTALHANEDGERDRGSQIVLNDSIAMATQISYGAAMRAMHNGPICRPLDRSFQKT